MILKSMILKCYYCGAILVWDSDSNLVEEEESNDAGTVSFFHCCTCGRCYEISDPFIEEKETTYRNYWKFYLNCFDMANKPKSEVFNMDCVAYMRTLPDNYFSLAIADPPYSHGNSEVFIKGGRFHKGRFNRYRQVDGNPIDIDEWDKTPSDEFFEQLFRVSENQIIWGANYFDGMPATRCFVVWKKQIPEQFSMAMCEYAWTSFQGNAKIVEYSQISKVDDKRFHPTQKPIELYAWLLCNYAKEGDTIFDPMMGSQSSRIAAYIMGFDYVGCEIEPLYYNKGNERFDRICKGIYILPNGTKIVQTSLFD